MAPTIQKWATGTPSCPADLCRLMHRHSGRQHCLNGGSESTSRVTQNKRTGVRHLGCCGKRARTAPSWQQGHIVVHSASTASAQFPFILQRALGTSEKSCEIFCPCRPSAATEITIIRSDRRVPGAKSLEHDLFRDENGHKSRFVHGHRHSLHGVSAVSRWRSLISRYARSRRGTPGRGRGSPLRGLADSRKALSPALCRICPPGQLAA
jgi:hypothetical protein